MKKFWSYIKNLSEVQTKKLSIIISSIISISFLGILLWVNRGTEIDIFVYFLSVVLTILIWVVLYELSYTLFGGYSKKYVKHITETKQKIILDYGLSKESYIEVIPNYDFFLRDSRYSKFLIAIFKNSNYKYYTKLTENEEIELIVKDKNQNIIYTDNLTNFFYFEAQFNKLS